MLGRKSWRNGCFRLASISSPRARSSFSTRSRSLTITWSRKAGFSSFRNRKASTNTIRQNAPQRRNCERQVVKVVSVVLTTALVTRLPNTGPMAHRPIAVARPTCGEKSRIRAGVATRMMPSTKPTTMPSTAKTKRFSASGTAKVVSRATTSRPQTTSRVRPKRSDAPARREAKAPRKLPMASWRTR